MRRIVSASNETLKRLRTLAHDGRARAAQGLAVIEGEHLCRAWLDHGRMPVSAFVDDEAVARPDIRDCLARLEAARVEVMALPGRLLRAACSTESALPIACIVPMAAGTLENAVGGDCVLLDGVQDPGNVGSILRTAAAAGVRHVVCGAGTASVWSPKVLRSAMGAHPVLDVVETADLGAAARQLGVRVLGTDGAAERTIYAADLRAPLAWVFGAEGSGLSPTMRAALSGAVSIPQSTAVESLNVAVAAAICLFEMRRQRMA